MNIGIIDQIKNNRYLITPDTARMLAASGSNVYFTTELDQATKLAISMLKSHKFSIKEFSEVKKIMLFIRKQLLENNNFTINNYNEIKRKIDLRIKKVYRDKIFTDINLINKIYISFYNKVSGYDFLKSNAIRRESNKDIIKSSNIITSYKIPNSEDLQLIEERHTLVCYSDVLKNHNKIKYISDKKANLLAIEYIQDYNGKRVIQEIISKLSSRVGFNIINSILNEQGVILGNIPFNEKLNVTIVGYGVVGKEIAELFHKFDCNITIFDKNMAILGDNSAYSFYSVYNEDKFQEYIEKSDVIINSIGEYQKPCSKIFTAKHINLIKKPTLLFDFSINQGGSVEGGKPTMYKNNISELYDINYLNPNFLYSGIRDILNSANISVSNYISNVIVMYLAVLLEEQFENMFFEDAFIVKKGIINENINFIDKNEVNISNIEDPFDLMDDEISKSWQQMDDVNELLLNATDYGDTNLNKE